ncbi:MAG: 3-deoxy-manno-octulosonate cytidylyltransferase [Desulfobacterales bacterium]|nr:3-deoxy-manno-octulosonate cytidylyltransferase [Desulfobacterales bacterium]
MKKTIAVIPARYGSSRFPGKMLTPIQGRPLILHVVERVRQSTLADICVATDHQEIYDAVTASGLARVVLTRGNHTCGTDRIAEVARDLDADYILNIQGDQLIPGPEMVDSILAAVDEKLVLATLFSKIDASEDPRDINVVKVIVNQKNDIVYMSRLPIPYLRESQPHLFYRQIGIYVFLREALLEFAALPKSRLEEVEGIELLRALECGIPLRGIETTSPTADVDIPADVALAEAFIKRHSI